MAQVIKYSTQTQSNTFRRGNLHYGTADIEWGPTNITGFYNGVAIPTGSVISYLWDGSEIRYNQANNDSELISFYANRSGLTFSSVATALTWALTQSDVMIVDKELEPVITDGLILHLDASTINSYPKGGTGWWSLSSATRVPMLNGPSFSNHLGGNIVFDTTNDALRLDQQLSADQWTISFWCKMYLTPDMPSSSIFFRNIPQAGPINEGFLQWGFDLFYGVTDCYALSDGSVIVGGQYGGYDNIIRDTIVKINSDGTLNNTFNTGIRSSGVFSMGKIRQSTDGKIYTATTNMGAGTGVAIFDPTTGGLFLGLSQSGSSICNSFILDDANNSVYILDSWIDTYQGQNVTGKIFKLSTTNFTIDTNFISSSGFKSAVGKTAVSLTEGVTDGIILNDGNLLCFGTFLEYKSVAVNRIVKINRSTAAYDNSFSIGTGFNASVNTAVQMNNQTIVLGGNFTSYNGTSANRIIGLNTNGTVNATFSFGTGFNGEVLDIIYDTSNDKLFITGVFTNYNGTTASRIIKLNSNGSVDGSFNTGTGFNELTFSSSLDPNGKLFVVGRFTSFNGQTTPRSICRLNANGSLDTSFSSLGFNLPRYRGNFTARLQGAIAQTEVSGRFGISDGREIFDTVNGLVNWNYENYITITFDTDKNFRFYRNGLTFSNLATTSNLPMKLNLCQLEFRDSVYSFSVYNRALSRSEVIYNYQVSLKKMLNQNFITDSLRLYLDAGYGQSFFNSFDFQQRVNTLFTSTWRDISGWGAVATLFNGPSYSTAGGGSIVFDGTNDYAIVGSQTFNSTTTSSFTIETVFRRNNSTPLNFDTIYLHGNGTGLTDSRVWMVLDNNNNGQLAINYFSGAGFDNYITLNNALFDTNFHHTVQVVDKSLNLMYGYYDNQLAGTSSIRPNSTTSVTTLDIAGINYADVTIGYIRIYSKALSASEITTNYNSQKTRFGLA